MDTIFTFAFNTFGLHLLHRPMAQRDSNEHYLSISERHAINTWRVSASFGTPHLRSHSTRRSLRCSHQRRSSGNTRLTRNSLSECMSLKVLLTKRRTVFHPLLCQTNTVMLSNCFRFFLDFVTNMFNKYPNETI